MDIDDTPLLTFPHDHYCESTELWMPGDDVNHPRPGQLCGCWLRVMLLMQKHVGQLVAAALTTALAQDLLESLDRLATED
jgi:hypothetical protein